MEALLLLIFGAYGVVCFLIGASVRQKVDKGEKIEMPTINPAEKKREKEERQKASKEQEIRDTLLYNIENYDGTGLWQKDIPR